MLMMIMMIERENTDSKYFSHVAVHEGPSAGGAVKIANMASGDGYWLDPSGIVWRSNLNSKGNHIPDYAPVCSSTTTTTLPTDDETHNR
jgi:hypothetical protein